MLIATRTSRRFAGALPIALALLTLACEPGFEHTEGDNGGEQPPAQRLVGAGAGSTWLLDIEDDDDFDLVERTRIGGTTRTSISGDFETLSSGYSRLSVSLAQGDNAPTGNPQLAALNLSDSLLLVRDWNANGQLMFFAANAECPSGNVSANWLQVSTANGQFANDANMGFFGNLSQTAGTDELQVDQSFGLTPEFPEQDDSDPLALGNCADGARERGASRVYYGEDGIVLIQQNAGTAQQSLWLALPRTQLTAADISGQYIGFWTDTNRAGDERVWNVTMECTDFDCEVERISDIEDLNSVTGTTMEIALDDDTLDEPAQGYLSGILTPTAGYTTPGLQTAARDIVCSANQDFSGSGDKVLICVGQSPNDAQSLVNGYFIATD